MLFKSDDNRILSVPLTDVKFVKCGIYNQEYFEDTDSTKCYFPSLSFSQAENLDETQWLLAVAESLSKGKMLFVEYEDGILVKCCYTGINRFKDVDISTDFKNMFTEFLISVFKDQGKPVFIRASSPELKEVHFTVYNYIKPGEVTRNRFKKDVSTIEYMSMLKKAMVR